MSAVAARSSHWLETAATGSARSSSRKCARWCADGSSTTRSASACVAGLAVAFFGAADALTGTGTSGRWTFIALMAAWRSSALPSCRSARSARCATSGMEQTLDLITLTALSPRRIVIGKLLAQGVKLATLFAAIAPFIAMSFLLGGIDFVTILVSLLVLFMWSLWVVRAAACSCRRCVKSRAMSGLVFGASASCCCCLRVRRTGDVFLPMRARRPRCWPRSRSSRRSDAMVDVLAIDDVLPGRAS